MPLPPYIRQSLGDSERYQTVYARDPGQRSGPDGWTALYQESLWMGWRRKGWSERT